MALSAFDDRSQEPNPEDLENTLGRSRAQIEQRYMDSGGPIALRALAYATKGNIVRGFLTKHWRKITIAAVCLPVVGFLVLCLAIGHGVRGAVSNAQERFPGEPVSALISVATDEQTGLAERNRAIWALGQLGSPEALPILQTMATGEPCDHDRLICQKEVAKAIEGCSGGTNIGWVIWRHGDLAVESNSGGGSP